MRKKGFTLIELLVVIAVMSLLMAVLVPAMDRARLQAKSLMCLSNLRQMCIAAQAYAASNDEHYPISYYREMTGSSFTSYCWDFTTTQMWTNGAPTSKVESGILWGANSMEQIYQCPVFKGQDNWLADPYTGYNYNTSYIGYNGTLRPVQSAKITEVRKPAWTALFGDGEYESGANKFMRAPWSNPRDAGFSGRYAGTQGYRHLGKTNVAFCDGHAQSWKDCYTQTYPSDQANIAPGTGFLSADNSIYDLE
jgi:prepilin-type N-terminal cleavage/methylation domain-containing protein/prepilin-type processing-associated H-X9-DG protein